MALAPETNTISRQDLLKPFHYAESGVLKALQLRCFRATACQVIFSGSKIKLQIQWERLSDSLSYDCKQRKGGKEAEHVLGSSTLSLPSCHFNAVVLVFKGVPLFFSDNLTWLKA